MNDVQSDQYNDSSRNDDDQQERKERDSIDEESQEEQSQDQSNSQNRPNSLGQYQGQQTLQNQQQSFIPAHLRDTSGLVYPPAHLVNNHYTAPLQNLQNQPPAYPSYQQQLVGAINQTDQLLQTKLSDSPQQQQSNNNQTQQLDLEEILLKLRHISQSLKPPTLSTVNVNQTPQTHFPHRMTPSTPQNPNITEQQQQKQNEQQEQLDGLWEWLQTTLSVDRFRKMSENIEKLSEVQVIQKAKEIELLALKLDIDQANEINRGKDFNIIKKS